MKKKYIAIALTVVVLIAILIPTIVVGVDNGVAYDSELTLENKTLAPDWDVIPDDTWGLLEYNTSDTSFDYCLTAEGLNDGEYALIYYPDTENRFVDWGGSGGIVIATVAVIDGSVDTGDVSVFLGTSLPQPTDANGYHYDYTLPPDGYTHATGAKIWLVPSSILTDGEMPVATWTPDDNWLFETDLITFEQLVSNPVGVAGDIETPVITLSMVGAPENWYLSATYEVTINAVNDTDVTIDGVYGKFTGWDTSMFAITYGDIGLEDCGFWDGDVFYFGPAGGDAYAPKASKSFLFSVTPIKAGSFDVGIVLVAGVADSR